MRQLLAADNLIQSYCCSQCSMSATADMQCCKLCEASVTIRIRPGHSNDHFYHYHYSTLVTITKRTSFSCFRSRAHWIITHCSYCHSILANACSNNDNSHTTKKYTHLDTLTYTHTSAPTCTDEQQHTLTHPDTHEQTKTYQQIL